MWLKRTAIRILVKFAFRKMWKQHVSIVGDPRPDPRGWGEQISTHDQTSGYRNAFFNTVMGLVEAYVTNPKDVKRAVKIAFQIAPKTRWGYIHEIYGREYSGGSDASLDRWVKSDEQTQVVYEGPDSEGTKKKKDEFQDLLYTRSQTS